MVQVRTKPVEVEALQFLGVDYVPEDDAARIRWAQEDVPAWVGEALALDGNEPGAMYPELGWSPHQLMIFTLEGVHCASPGDWVIRGVRGELYPCKPDIFDATYDLLEE